MVKNYVKTLLLMFLIVLCLSFVSAVVDYTTPEHIYTFEGNSSDRSSNSMDGTLSGSPVQTTGINGNGYDFESTDSGDKISFSTLDLDRDMTISFWVKLESHVTGTIWMWGDTNSQAQFNIWSYGDGEIYFDISDGSSPSMNIKNSSTAINTGEWYNIIMTYDKTGVIQRAYINGVLKGTNTQPATWSGTGTSGTNTWSIGSYNYVSQLYADTIIDELYIYNYTMGQSEITSLQTEFYPFSVLNNAPEFSLISPSNNSHISDLTPSFNFYYNDTESDDGNCSLYIDDVLKDNVLNITADSSSSLTSTTLNNSVYNWYINCSDSVNNVKSETRILTIDTVNPVINWVFPSVSNDTVIPVDYSGNLNITLSDSYLFAYNLTISNSSGVIYNDAVVDLNVSSFNLANAFDFTGQTGDFIVDLTVSDDHTARVIPDYDFISSPTSLTFNTPTNTISLEAVEGSFGKLGAIKETDRYTFFFEFGNGKKEHQINLKCDEKLYYRGGLYDYPVFVCGSNWVDFDISNLNPSNIEAVIVKKINDNNYNINVKTYGTVNRIDFHSIGGLNIVSESVLIQTCVSDWVCDGFDICAVDDTTTCNSVVDNNACGFAYTGNYSEVEATCNYCSQSLVQVLGSCGVDETQSVSYYDNNFFTCCDVTGLSSDCSILVNPYNTTTSQSCSYLTVDFNCTIPSNVEFKDKMSYTCVLPFNDNFSCVNEVYEDGRLLQVNPEYKDYTTGLIGGKAVELKTAFTPSNNLLNAYFTDKNLLTDKTFTVKTVCSGDSGVLSNEIIVTPFYEGVSSVINRGVWLGNNAGAVILWVILGLLLVVTLGWAVKKSRGY